MNTTEQPLPDTDQQSNPEALDPLFSFDEDNSPDATGLGEIEETVDADD